MISQEIIKTEDFDFYGLRFGMERKQIESLYRVESKNGLNRVQNPGHHMDSLFLYFDYRKRLFRIEAYYKYNVNEEAIALSYALKEKFEDLIAKFYQDIEIKIETHSKYESSQFFVMILTSKSIENDYIGFLKNEILMEMK